MLVRKPLRYQQLAYLVQVNQTAIAAKHALFYLKVCACTNQRS